MPERVRAEVRGPRQPLQVRRAVLEAAARTVYIPAWLLGRLARAVVAAARFAWQAGQLGLADGYRGKEA